MILHTKRAHVACAQPLYTTVVQIHMRDFDIGWQTIRSHGKSVIVAADLYSSVRKYRLIASSMAKLHLVRAAAQSQTQNLVSQTDAKDWHSV